MKHIFQLGGDSSHVLKLQRESCHQGDFEPREGRVCRPCRCLKPTSRPRLIWTFSGLKETSRTVLFRFYGLVFGRVLSIRIIHRAVMLQKNNFPLSKGFERFSLTRLQQVTCV